jgi:hypothetical protein
MVAMDDTHAASNPDQASSPRAFPRTEGAEAPGRTTQAQLHSGGGLKIITLRANGSIVSAIVFIERFFAGKTS